MLNAFDLLVEKNKLIECVPQIMMASLSSITVQKTHPAMNSGHMMNLISS
jgi:hypothetical protein